MSPPAPVVPAGRKLTRKPARLDYPLIVKSQVAEASFIASFLVYNEAGRAGRLYARQGGDQPHPRAVR